MADTGALEPLIEVLEDEREKKYGISFSDDRLAKAKCPWKVFYGCNASVRISHLRAVGGFDQSFVGYGLEDNELAYRLFTLGIRFVLSDRIPVFHEKPANPRDPYKSAIQGSPADFTTYVENAKRFIRNHKDDPEVAQVLGQALAAIETYTHENDNGPWLGYRKGEFRP
ncbi:unnamed protein product, partial [marine sediment metagenome]